MSEQTSHLSLPLIAANQAQKHVPVNEALVRLDALVQLSVLDRTLSDPPSSPEDGDRYIVGDAATGGWAGRDDDVASYDAGWIFAEPQEGWRAWDAAAQELVVFTDGAWTVVTSGAGGFDAGELQNVELLGVGSEADETNPFSAKLNNALWASKEISEGGTGDLRYVLNKEASANVLSLLFQSAYSGRAEFGLIGDDDLLFKVSADGTTWREALRIDRTTGKPSFPQGGVRQQLTANRTYYIRTDGSDSNNGLTNTSGGAFLTRQHAYDLICSTLDLAGYTVTIQIADGTYTGGLTISQPWTGGGAVTFQGNSSTPANVIVNATSAACCRVNCPLPGVLLIKDMELRTTTSGNGIQLNAPGVINFSNINFGALGGSFQAHIIAGRPGALVEAVGNYAITGGAGAHIYAVDQGQVKIQGRTVTLTGTPAFGDTFVSAARLGYLAASSVTFSGSATGKRFDVSNGGVLFTNGGGATYFPGNSAGTGTNFGNSPYGHYS